MNTTPCSKMTLILGMYTQYLEQYLIKLWSNVYEFGLLDHLFV